MMILIIIFLSKNFYYFYNLSTLSLTLIINCLGNFNTFYQPFQLQKCPKVISNETLIPANYSKSFIVKGLNLIENVSKSVSYSIL